MKLDNLSSFKQFKKLNENISGTIRVRFAPSPTGPLHIGGVRTALYNYLFAKKNNGKFILRIEDTDSTRFVPGAEEYIIESFKWLGITFDEGPNIGGPYGPYRQSERRSIYDIYYKKLIESGKAYYAFDTADEIDAKRQEIDNFAYDAKTRMNMKNSLTMDPGEVKRLLSERDDWVVRIKFEPNQTITVNDLIRGTVTVNSSTLDDKVLYKAKDDLPTYHLANIVDDHTMKITHVIRGEEWLPSAPLHVYLYESFGWEAPKFAHLPLIMKPVGNGKLSKRDGDKYGFPVFPLEWKDPNDSNKTSMGYREQGYVPDGVINMLAFLGWNPGTDKEVYTLDELVQDFDLKRVQKGGARFNMEKAAWFNGQHLRKMDVDTLAEMFEPYLVEKGINLPMDKIKKLVEMGRGRVNFVKDMYDAVSYIFESPKTYDRKVLRKKWTDDSPERMKELAEKFRQLNTWDYRNIKETFENYVEESGVGFGVLMPVLRLAITGQGFGPDIFEMLETIGKEEVINRLMSSDSIKK